jgi:hypothetical protein
MDKIAVENVNHPGSVQRLDAAMYGEMKRALLAVLPEHGQGLTLQEIRERIAPDLCGALYPGGAKAGWWLKAVQLDLEAKKIIARERTSPLRLHRT